MYLILLTGFRVNVLPIYLPVWSEIATAALVSFVMWLLTIGWFDEFGIIEVELDADRESSSESR